MPGRVVAQLVLQHNLWEPQHVRGQAQDTDISKFFSIPLQPGVRPALEPERYVSSRLCCCPGSPCSPHFPGGTLDRVWEL